MQQWGRRWSARVRARTDGPFGDALTILPRNRIKLPMGVVGNFELIDHPGASLAVSIMDAASNALVQSDLLDAQSLVIRSKTLFTITQGMSVLLWLWRMNDRK